MAQRILMDETEQLYEELTATFDEKEQFRLLNELIESEIELQEICNN